MWLLKEPYIVHCSVNKYNWILDSLHDDVYIENYKMNSVDRQMKPEQIPLLCKK